MNKFLGFGYPQSDFTFKELIKRFALRHQNYCLISLLFLKILLYVCVVVIFLLVVIVGKHLFTPLGIVWGC